MTSLAIVQFSESGANIPFANGGVCRAGAPVEDGARDRDIHVWPACRKADEQIVASQVVYTGLAQHRHRGHEHVSVNPPSETLGCSRSDEEVPFWVNLNANILGASEWPPHNLIRISRHLKCLPLRCECKADLVQIDKHRMHGVDGSVISPNGKCNRLTKFDLSGRAAGRGSPA